MPITKIGKRRSFALAALATICLSYSAFVMAKGWLLHEPLRSNPDEDAALGLLSGSGLGSSRAKLNLGSGAQVLGTVYGGSHTQESADANFQLDPLTVRPNSVRYDEPFRPSLAPFKRVYAYDQVRPDYSLGVVRPELQDVEEEEEPGSGASGPTQGFSAELEVDLQAGRAVRLASPSAHFSLTGVQTSPVLKLSFYRDSADNLFVRADRNLRVRMRLEFLTEVRSFQAPALGDDWGRLTRPPALPAPLQAAAERVLATVGASRVQTPEQALAQLVEYYRGFVESAAPVVATHPVQLYEELSLARHGVCRHRAYAFMVSALALGLPTRLVHNEAHAWVEVGDGQRFGRVDLGGAPLELEASWGRNWGPSYKLPPDPLAWPKGASSGQDLELLPQAQSPRQKSGWPGATGLASSPTRPLEPADPASAGPEAGADLPHALLKDLAPRLALPRGVSVQAQLQAAQVLRGESVELELLIERNKFPCPSTRVDVFLAKDELVYSLGSRATDEHGRAQLSLILPSQLEVGSYQLRFALPHGCALATP